jgi:ribosomal protein S18 acetylase RimI-like enzyme
MTQITDFEIRPLSPADHPAVLALSAQLTIGAAPGRGPDRIAAAARGWIESALASVGQDGHTVLVAVLDGQVAGMISLAEREHFTGEVDAYISELAVGRGYEGRGAGRALLAAADRWAAGRGLARITLDTGAANHRAQRLYARNGFVPEDIRLSKPIGTGPETGQDQSRRG